MGIVEKIAKKIVGKSITMRQPYIRELLGLTDENKITKPYEQHTVVYAAIRRKADAIAMVPWVISGENGEIIDSTDHPAVRLFDEVNPYMSKYELWEAIVILLDLYGEAFVVKDREEYKGLPVYLWIVRPDTMKEQVYGGRLVAWEYTANGSVKMLYPEEVIQFKYYNPYNIFRGLAPAKVLKETIETDGEAAKYNKRFFENDGTPGAVFTTEQQLTDTQYRRLKAQLIESRQGSIHAFRAMLLDGGIDVKNLSANLKDMQFLELRKYSKEEIAMVFGIPKQELQLYEDINYATARTIEVGYWKKTLIPLMRKIEDKINKELLSSLNVYGWFDVNQVDVLLEELNNKVDIAAKLVSLGVPFDAINERLDLGFEEGIVDDWAPTEPVQEGRGAGVKKSIEEVTKDRRAAEWRKRVEPLYPLFGRVSRAVKNYFYFIEQKLIKELLKRSKAADFWVRKAEDDFAWIDQMFDDERLVQAVKDDIEKSIRMGIRQHVVPDEITQAIQAKRMNKIRGINQTASKEVKERLRQAIIDAMTEGITEEERTEVIINALKGSMDVNRNRARTIARTEVHGAYNESSFEAARSAGVKKLRWLSSRDDRVRDSHAELDGEVIEVGEKFSNGLRYPMDPGGAPEEVINCRCAFEEIYK